MVTPIISIIVPVYNAENFLRDCLNSIQAQSFNDWECILVDDGSMDGSAEICDEFASIDERFKVLHKKNSGVSAARNDGIIEAKGEWITFVDSDDWLEGEVMSLPSNTNNDIDLLFFDCLSIKESGKVVDHYDAMTYDRAQLQSNYQLLMFRQCLLGPWAKFFRRDVIVKYNIRFDVNIKWAEDRLFNLQFLSFCRNIQLVGKGYYVYRYPNAESSIMKYHPTVPMIHDLYNKMREASMRLNAKKGERAYLILWQTIEKVALLSDLTQEKYRKAFFKENTTFHTILKLDPRDIFFFLLCAFTPRTFHEKIMLHKLDKKQ